MSDQVVIKVVQNPIRIQMEEPDPIDVHIVEGRDGKSLHPAGAWSSAATYAYLDIVTKDGSSYVALKAVPAGTAVTNTTYWQLLAEAGADGASDWEDITNKPETFPPADHTHGNITAAGAITSSATIANNDSLIIRDNSASSELTSSSITFDGSTTTKALTPKGTWESFASQTDFDTLGDAVDDISADVTDIKSAINNLSNNKADTITDTASGSIVIITDGAEGLPVVDLTVDIEPVQDTSSGDPSPTNVCPISGWDEINVWDDSMYGGTIRWNQLAYNSAPVPESSIASTITITKNDDGSITITGKNTTSSNRYADSITSWLPTGHVYFVGNTYGATHLGTGGNTGTFNLFCHYRGATTSFSKVGTAYHRVIKPSNDTYSQFEVRIQFGYNATEDYNDTFFIQIFDLTEMFGEEKADEIFAMGEVAGAAYFKSLFPNDYYPYNDAYTETTVGAVNDKDYRNVTVDLSDIGTVYGGSLDLTTGELTVTHAIIELDGNENWVLANTGVSNYFYTYQASIETNTAYTPFCNKYPPVYPSSSWSNTAQGIVLYSTGWIRIRWGEEDTLANFKASLAEEPLQIVYPLATPLTYQLSAEQLTTLLGTNHIWVDSGDVEVEYRADTKLYIQRLTKPTEDDMTANNNIASGEFFMIGNSLYLATTAIASGATIVEGTNCTRLSLADALNQLNA